LAKECNFRLESAPTSAAAPKYRQKFVAENKETPR
jgi:hypothetical protein